MKKIIGLLVTAALVPAALAAATPAHAGGFATAHTVVTWSGTSCIETQGAQLGSAYLLSRPTLQCDYTGEPESLAWDETRYSGQWIGVDPIMGDADWIACSIAVGGQVFTDFARAGDGTDVSCLRSVNY